MTSAETFAIWALLQPELAGTPALEDWARWSQRKM